MGLAQLVADHHRAGVAHAVKEGLEDIGHHGADLSHGQSVGADHAEGYVIYGRPGGPGRFGYGGGQGLVGHPLYQIAVKGQQFSYLSRQRMFAARIDINHQRDEFQGPGDDRGQSCSLYAQPGQAEVAVDQAVVQEGVGGHGHGRNNRRRSQPVDAA